jgi:hypothetical protein
MKGKIGLAAIAAAFLLFGGTAVAQEFSADMISTAKGMVVTGKIFVAKGKSRMETSGAITITRADKNVTWILMPEQKMYMVQTIKPEAVAAAGEMPGQVEKTLIGSEMVDGKATRKYKIVYKVDNQDTAIYQWISKKLNIPVKTEAVDGSWKTECKNIKTGKQPGKLFEIPEGYKKLSLGMPLIPQAETEKKSAEKEEKKPWKLPFSIPKLPKKLW